jgi:MSHA pilin protein MshD
VKPASSSERRQRGFTLVDVLLVIVLLGVIGASLTGVSARLASQSAQTLITRQALAFAHGLLAEVTGMPFTYCDEQGANPLTAGSVAACTSLPDGPGVEGAESRYLAWPNRFDGVSDYNDFAMPAPGCPGLCDIRGIVLNATGPLAGCSARVTTARQALPGIPATEALRVIVAMTCPAIGTVYAEGLRVRHAPNRF